MAAAQGNNGVCAVDSPEHAGLFESGADDGFASGFDDAGAYEEVLAAELGIPHALGIALEVRGFDPDRLLDRGCGRVDRAKEPDQVADLAAIEFRLMAQYPLLLTEHVAGVDQAGYVPKVLAGMEQIDDLNRAGKVPVRIVPDPFGTVADHNLLYGAAPAAVPGFQIDPVTELAGGFDRACIGG